MPSLPRAQGPSQIPSSFKIANALYGQAFEARTPEEVGEAMADWQLLDEAERSFAIGHLLYLNLRLQAAQLVELRSLRRSGGVMVALLQERLEEEDEGEDVDGGGGGQPGISPLLDTEALALATAEAEALGREMAEGAGRADAPVQGGDADDQ